MHSIPTIHMVESTSAKNAGKKTMRHTLIFRGISLSEGGKIPPPTPFLLAESQHLQLAVIVLHGSHLQAQSLVIFPNL